MTEPFKFVVSNDPAKARQAIGAAREAVGAASAAFPGDSLSALNADTVNDSYGESYPSLAIALTKGRFVFGGNFGVPSNTVQQIAARIGDVIAAKPGRAVVLAGSNSTTKGISHFNDARSVYETGIIMPLLAAGIQPILCTIPPRDFTRQWAAGDNVGPGVYLLTSAWNVFVRSMAAKYRLPLCDMYAAVTDPNTGNYVDGYTEDGVHWAGKGIYAAAQAAADALTNPVVPAVCLEHDRYSLINICSSPLFLGGLGSGTGSLYPSGWNGPGSGIATSIVNSTGSDGLDAGKWLRLEKTGTSSLNVNMIRTLSAMATNGVTVNTGDRIALGFRYVIEDFTYDPNAYVTFSMVFRDSGGATLKTATPLNQIKHGMSGVVWWETTVPANTVDIRLNVQFSAEGSINVQLGQMSIYDLTAIGSPSLQQTDLAIPTSSLSVPADPANPVPNAVSIAAGTATAATIPYTITNGVGGTTPTSYEVQYCLPQNLGTWTSGGGSSTTGTITGLTNNQKYWIRARGVSAGGAGPWSPYVAVTTALADSPPAQVTGLTAGIATTSTQALTWTAPALTSGYVLQYKRHVDSTWITFSTPTTNAETVTGLTAGTSYDYRVAATNNAGTGTYSSTTTASTVATPTVLASDSFNRSDTSPGTLGALDYAAGGTVTGLTWTTEAQIGIVSNRAGGTTTTTRRATVDLGVSNMYVEVEVVSNEGGVYARYTDTSNQYVFYYNASQNKLVLDKRVAGSTTTLWSSSVGAFTPGAGQAVGLDVQGSTLRAFANGSVVTTQTDSSLATGTKAGMRAAATGSFAMDNWKAQDFAA